MSTVKKPNHRWLPLALVPLFSVSVLVGCDSDDDTPATTSNGSSMVAGDNDNDGIPDGFQTADPADSNGIIDDYEPATADADTNNNNIDDSFEPAITGGLDENNDGIDDAAASSIISGGNGGETGGTGGETGGTGGETGGTGGETGGTGGETGGTGGETGDINVNTVLIGNGGSAGTADLSWNGSTLSGDIIVADGRTANSVALYSGIAAAGTGEQAVVISGDGTTFSIPGNLGVDQAALISNNISSGNLFIRMEMSDGSIEPGTILFDTVQAKYADLRSQSTVPPRNANSTGAGHININTATGEFTAAVVISLNVDDATSISTVKLHTGGTGENGETAVTLNNLNGDGVTWVAKGELSTADLSSLLRGRTYFNVYDADENTFIRGQVPGS